MFATKPQLVGNLLDHAHAAGIGAAFATGDEVYGGRQLRRWITEFGPPTNGPGGVGDKAQATAVAHAC